MFMDRDAAGEALGQALRAMIGREPALGAAGDARVVMADAVRAFTGHVLADLLDDAVAIQVIRSVFVGDPVAIVVHRHMLAHGAPCR